LGKILIWISFLCEEGGFNKNLVLYKIAKREAGHHI
jgi:hypothetical protein